MKKHTTTSASLCRRPRFKSMCDHSKKNLSPVPPSLADVDLDGPWCRSRQRGSASIHLDFQSLVIAAYELWCEEEWPLIQGLAMIWGLLYSLTYLVGVIKFLAMREG